jgi:hypothetical protein
MDNSSLADKLRTCWPFARDKSDAALRIGRRRIAAIVDLAVRFDHPSEFPRKRPSRLAQWPMASDLKLKGSLVRRRDSHEQALPFDFRFGHGRRCRLDCGTRIGATAYRRGQSRL